MLEFIAQACLWTGFVLLVLGAFFKAGKGISADAKKSGNKMLIMGGSFFGAGLVLMGLKLALDRRANSYSYYRR